MNILFVHETEYIEKVVFEYQIVPEILASRGHSVYVLDFPSVWKRKSWFDFGSLRTQELNNVRRAGKKEGITLIRPGVIKIPIISRLYASLSYWWIIPRVLKEKQIEAIVLYSAPTNGIQTIFWAKRYQIPVFFRLFDVLHQLVPYKILRWPTLAAEKYIFRRVQALAAVTPKLTDYTVQLGAPAARSFYLPTGSDADLLSPAPKDPELLKKYGISKKDTVLLFAGTLFNFSGLDLLIEYLGTHQKELAGTKLVIVGHGEQEQRLQQLIHQYQLGEEVILTGFVQYEQLADYINLADVCINTFSINKLTKNIIPGKIYQYLACGKPVIATRLPGMLNLYPEKPGSPVLYCEENNAADFFGKVAEALAIDARDQSLTLQNIADKYEKTLTELVKPGRQID